MDNFDWYCDNCGCYMNNQKGFTTHSGKWVCAECRYENNVTNNNIRKKKYHVFRCIRMGFEREIDGVYFDADMYDRYSAEAQFEKCYGSTTKNNGKDYSYSYYEYNGVKYYEIDYVGECDGDNLPHGYSGCGFPWAH